MFGMRSGLTPKKNMHECQTEDKWGDQGFLGSVMKPVLWQDIIPGSVVSYKCHIATRKMIGYNPDWHQIMLLAKFLMMFQLYAFTVVLAHGEQDSIGFLPFLYAIPCMVNSKILNSV